MNTPSHLLITAALRKSLKDQSMVTSACLCGAVAPDMLLYLLSFGGLLYYRVVLGWSSRATFRHMFDYLYFHHPLWLVAHNFLHAPLLLLLAFACLRRLRHRPSPVMAWLYWFVLACLLHTTIDVFTHVDDGPLLLFPVQWSLRFHSPVSYWDSAHYGDQFALFELTLDALLLCYLCAPLLRRLAVARLRGQRGEAG